MEETIKEIENAEAAARALINKANENADKIYRDAEEEIALMKNDYEQRLVSESEAIIAGAKADAARISAAAEENSSAKAEKIKLNARDKIKPCTDFVYDHIIGEFTK